jgi:ATP adenylyltransferase
LTREYFFSFDKLPYLKGKKPPGCILCLIRDRAPEVVDLSVYRDDLFIVSINLYPYNPGHLLVFPRRHIEDIRRLTGEEEERLARLQRYLLDAADRILQPSGYNIGYNMGLPAGASIAHLHLHIIPRYPRELGIADLIAGKRVLVESPQESAERFRRGLAQEPFSNTSS